MKINFKNKSGIALVHTLVMSIILGLIAVAILRTILGNEILVAHMVDSSTSRYWVEACLAQKQTLWQGTPCNQPLDGTCIGAGTQCSCSYTDPNGIPISVTVNCSGAGNSTLQFTVTY
ncbi:MAG: hypothetical protein HY399_04050 [Elusimicrobia bacterium]|nr:hypothetical protein [Elusimicrobiota bacterium]